MDNINTQKLSKLFMNEFHRVTQAELPLIKSMIKSRLSNFSEAADLENITFSCIGDIELILSKQLQDQPLGHFNLKEKHRKLIAFSDDKTYVKKYVLEATKSFCRKKRHYWGHGQNNPDIEKGETHKEKKAGRAARVHGTGDSNQVDNWITSIATSGLKMNSLQSETVEALNELFISIGLSEKKIRCFWYRFDGMTFVDMAKQHKDKAVTPDKYRKRFKRLITQLESQSDKFRNILMQDFG